MTPVQHKLRRHKKTSVVSIDKIVILFTIAAGTWMDAGGGDVISCHVAAAYSRQIEPPRPTRFALLV